MWLLTGLGFFSIVRKPWDAQAGTLTVRGRVRADLERLRSGYLPAASPIEEDARADYRFRFTAGVEDLALAVGLITADIDYDNFKDEIDLRQGRERHDIYLEVWRILRCLEGIEASTREENGSSAGL